MQYVAISPYNKEHYFIAYKDRTVKYNFAGCPEWIPQIQEVFNEWQAEILQRQGIQPPPSIPPVPAIPPQWNQYLPTAGQPTYVAAHYANAVPPPPQHSPYNPHAVPPPQQFAVELPGTMLEPPRPPMSARPASIMTSASVSASYLLCKTVLTHLLRNGVSSPEKRARSRFPPCLLLLTQPLPKGVRHAMSCKTKRRGAGGVPTE